MKHIKFPPKTNPHCSVCSMEVKDDNLLHDYRGIQYYFCSQHCLDRFVALPGLYCGNPKTGESEKQKGRVELKTHRIIFSDQLSTNELTNITECVTELMGIKNLTVTYEMLLVTYDLIELSLEEIEHAIEGVLGKIRSPMVERLKRSWIHFSEECELENLAHQSKDGYYH